LGCYFEERIFLPCDPLPDSERWRGKSLNYTIEKRYAMVVVYKNFFNKMILGAILLLIANLILSTSICFAQEDKPSTDNFASETKKVITAPKFPGGKMSLPSGLLKISNILKRQRNREHRG
jgi:hypothetical protein